MRGWLPSSLLLTNHGAAWHHNGSKTPNNNWKIGCFVPIDNTVDDSFIHLFSMNQDSMDSHTSSAWRHLHDSVLESVSPSCTTMRRKIDFLWKKEKPLMSFISGDFEKTIETAPSSIPRATDTFNFVKSEDWYMIRWCMKYAVPHVTHIDARDDDWLTPSVSSFVTGTCTVL
jgi:hypothetical protein